jgi:hypothetical protein
MLVVLKDTNGDFVAKKDLQPDRVRGATVFIHEGVNYAFDSVETIFTQCGTVEEF